MLLIFTHNNNQCIIIIIMMMMIMIMIINTIEKGSHLDKELKSDNLNTLNLILEIKLIP